MKISKKKKDFQFFSEIPHSVNIYFYILMNSVKDLFFAEFRKMSILDEHRGYKICQITLLRNSNINKLKMIKMKC